MTVAEMLYRISSEEIANWQILFEIEDEDEEEARKSRENK